MKIIEGVRQVPLKAVFYGPEGIGKSTLASRAPNPLFVDTEGGTNQLNVRRTQKPLSWLEFLADIEEVAKTPSLCQTLVIDTADWAEILAINHICNKNGVNGLESFGYGKGYTYVGEEMSKMLTTCDKVISAGVNVVILAHAKMRKQELPDEQGAFDRWELKVSKQSAPLLKEWPDLLLFLNYKTMVVENDEKVRKAVGGKRVMRTTHNPVWDAKNRFGLPDEMDMSFDGIANLFVSGEKPIDTVRSMMEEAGVSDAQVQAVVAQRGQYSAETPISEYGDKFLTGWLIKYWDKVLELINNSEEVANNG